MSQRKSIPGCEIEESNAILPNGHDGTNLYKLTMAQSVFQEQMSDVDSLLQDSNIMGLYESNIDPVSRAIIDLGNTVKFDDTRVGALGKGLKTGFNTRELIKASSEVYLRKFDMDIVYLLHIVTNSYEFLLF